MYCGIYAPWDHAPKFLRHSEVGDPLIVVKYFFDADDVEGHGDRLKIWRNHVVNEGCFSDSRFGPGTLVYDYELNVRLLEALYLLLLRYQDRVWKKKKVTEEQLNEERNTWNWFPKNLSDQELLNPYALVEAVFEEVKPQEFRDHLSEWLHAALSNDAVDEDMTPGEIISIYEHLVKLYSAAWLIYQRESEKPQIVLNLNEHRKPIGLTAMMSNREREEAGLPPLVRRGINVPSAAEVLGLNELTKFISEKNTDVRLIIHLQTFNDPFVYYLLIIVDNGTQLSNEDAAVRIEQECAHLVSVVAFVKKIKWLDAVLQGKLKDFCYAILPGNVRYRSPLFEKSNEIRSPLRICAADIKESWDKWGDEGHGLFFEALNLQVQGRYPECLLRVSRSITYSLKALIGMYTGHIPKTIDIARLLKMSLMCTSSIWRIFYKNSESSRQALKILFSIDDDNDQTTDTELNEPALNVLMLNAHLLTVFVEHEYLGLLQSEEMR